MILFKCVALYNSTCLDVKYAVAVIYNVVYNSSLSPIIQTACLGAKYAVAVIKFCITAVLQSACFRRFKICSCSNYIISVKLLRLQA